MGTASCKRLQSPQVFLVKEIWEMLCLRACPPLQPDSRAVLSGGHTGLLLRSTLPCMPAARPRVRHMVKEDALSLSTVSLFCLEMKVSEYSLEQEKPAAFCGLLIHHRSFMIFRK